MPSLREIIKKLRKILFLGQVVCFTPVLKYCEFTFISTGKEMKRISRKETWKLPCQKNPQNPFWELLEAPMAKRRHSYLPLPPKTILLRYVKKILVSTLAHATCVLRSQWIFLFFIPLLSPSFHSFFSSSTPSSSSYYPDPEYQGYQFSAAQYSYHTSSPFLFFSFLTSRKLIRD